MKNVMKNNQVFGMALLLCPVLCASDLLLIRNVNR